MCPEPRPSDLWFQQLNDYQGQRLEKCQMICHLFSPLSLRCFRECFCNFLESNRVVNTLCVKGGGGGGALPCAEHLNAMNHLLQSSTVFKIQPNAKILLSPHLKILQWWN